MTRRPWMFWKREEPGSSSLSHADVEACREWTPFLTSLFDGEASEKEALRARRHLIVCERCARTWLDWNQTRNLLINHSAPPPPPNLLWRVRLACRLGQPREVAAPELGAQILARTSRQNAKPAFWSSLAPRALRLNSPFVGALAVGAFVVLMARGSLFSTPSQPQIAVNTSSTQVRARHLSAPVRMASRRNTRPEAPILAPRSQVVSSHAPSKSRRVVKIAVFKRNPFAERSSVSLAIARRERETLEQMPIRLISLDSGAPLPMLTSPRVRPSAHKKLHRAVTSARPVVLPPRLEAPSVVLASAPATSSASEPSSRRTGRAPRVLLASAGAPLRISAPNVLPLTMQQASAPDDSGLDDLDSTVQEYRTTLADDSDSNFDAG